MTEWMEFKKTFTQKQEDAIWQYFVDHSKIQDNGYWLISFFIRDIDDFWKRLHARYSGDFQRYSKLKKAHIQESKSYFMKKRMDERWAKKVEAVDKGANLFHKLLLWSYRFSRDYITKHA